MGARIVEFAEQPLLHLKPPSYSIAELREDADIGMPGGEKSSYAASASTNSSVSLVIESVLRIFPCCIVVPVVLLVESSVSCAVAGFVGGAPELLTDAGELICSDVDDMFLGRTGATSRICLVCSSAVLPSLARLSADDILWDPHSLSLTFSRSRSSRASLRLLRNRLAQLVRDGRGEAATLPPPAQRLRLVAYPRLSFSPPSRRLGLSAAAQCILCPKASAIRDHAVHSGAGRMDRLLWHASRRTKAPFCPSSKQVSIECIHVPLVAHRLTARSLMNISAFHAPDSS